MKSSDSTVKKRKFDIFCGTDGKNKLPVFEYGISIRDCKPFSKDYSLIISNMVFNKLYYMLRKYEVGGLGWEYLENCTEIMGGCDSK